MTTKNPRINVTVKKPTSILLALLAKRQQTSVSTIANACILQALELQEDVALCQLAERRDFPQEKSHAGKCLEMKYTIQ